MEASDVLAGLAQAVQFAALLLQVVKGRADVTEHCLVHGGERLRQRPRQALGIGALGQLRLAQLNQQRDQRIVALAAELEQLLVDSTAVLLGSLSELAPRTDRLGEPVTAQGGAGVTDQEEVLPDPLGGEEVPSVGDAPPVDGFEGAPDSEVGGRAVGGQPGELQPGVAQALVVPAAEQEVPLHPLAGVAVGLHPVCRDLPVE